MEAGWQANLFVEIRVDDERRPLAQALNDLAPNLQARKADFREVGRDLGMLPCGWQYGRLGYTCLDEQTGLTEWEVVVVMGEQERVFVLASAASAVWDTYQPVFQSFLQSVGPG